MKNLTNLKEGAKLCLANSQRLLDDAETLFYKERYHSCFLLGQLCLEELAKGFKLIEKEKQKEHFTENEWDEITKRQAHKKKLVYLQEVEDKWKEEVSGFELEMFATSMEEKENHADLLYNWRMDSLYVNYNFNDDKWIDPLSSPVILNVPVYYTECNSIISRAGTLVHVLAAKLNF